MIGWTGTEIWLIIVALGVATYTIRFSFLGLIGNRELPDWLLRHLRYTPVAILPALVTPGVLWPEGSDGSLSLPHIASAVVALGVGYWRKSAVLAAVCGVLAFVGLNALL
ncbi:AzlD domain-containing protein [Gymnodinialimonas hymeniacidonis]|uniref:AzlD domain-containing protein n=1 Tax=Gymnodinialimonas hymeniacidonis TaxID=3126508 RepID=UPI0034C5EF67